MEFLVLVVPARESLTDGEQTELQGYVSRLKRKKLKFKSILTSSMHSAIQAADILHDKLPAKIRGFGGLGEKGLKEPMDVFQKRVLEGVTLLQSNAEPSLLVVHPFWLAAAMMLMGAGIVEPKRLDRTTWLAFRPSGSDKKWRFESYSLDDEGDGQSGPRW